MYIPSVLSTAAGVSELGLILSPFHYLRSAKEWFPLFRTYMGVNKFVFGLISSLFILKLFVFRRQSKPNIFSVVVCLW